MKTLAPAIVAVAFLVINPRGAWAGDAAAPMPPFNAAAFQVMDQAHARVGQLHAQARLTILNALTPAHRALLGQVIGNLAIAANPDVTGAARTLDANLSPAEARTIVSVATALEQQSKQIMMAAHQQMMNAMPPPPNGPTPPKPDVVYNHQMGANEAALHNDPGFILIHMAALPEGPMFFIATQAHRAP